MLTVGLLTYSSDDRFQVEHTRHQGNWALRIKSARKEDEGYYECQISTHPPQSIFVELRIVGEWKIELTTIHHRIISPDLSPSSFPLSYLFLHIGTIELSFSVVTRKLSSNGRGVYHLPTKRLYAYSRI